MKKQTEHPDWVLQHKRPDTEIRLISGKYYLDQIGSQWEAIFKLSVRAEESGSKWKDLDVSKASGIDAVSPAIQRTCPLKPFIQAFTNKSIAIPGAHLQG